jgi:hypothetical protein
VKTAIITVIAMLVMSASTHVRAETRVLVREDFEDGIDLKVTCDPVGRETGFMFDAPAPRLRAMLAVVDPGGNAGAEQEEVIAVSGSRSLLLRDSMTAQSEFMPALTWWLYGDQRISRGTLRIQFDLYVPEQDAAEFELNTRDYSEERGNRRRAHFSLRVRNGRVYLGHKHVPVSPGSWSRILITHPVGVADGLVTMTMTDAKGVEHTLQQTLDHPVNRVTMISMFMPASVDGFICLDNLLIAVDECTHLGSIGQNSEGLCR